MVVGTSANRPSNVAVPEHMTAALAIFNISDDFVWWQFIPASSCINSSTNSLAEPS